MNFPTLHVLMLGVLLSSCISPIQAQDEFPKGAYAEPIRTISTIVVDANEDPVPEATVKLYAGDRVTTHRAGPDGRLDVLIPESMLSKSLLFASDVNGLQMKLIRIGQELRKGNTNEWRIVLKPALPIHVLVTDANEVPLPDVWVGERPFVSTRTDAKGRAVLLAPQHENSHLVYALDSKHGMNYQWLLESELIIGGSDGAGDHQPVLFRLEGFQEPVKITVTDQNGDPVAGAHVTPREFANPKLKSIFLPYATIDDFEFGALTDQQGIARLNAIPAWNENNLVFIVRKAGYSEEIIYLDIDRGPRELRSRLIRRVLVKGRVGFPEGFQPTGIQIRFRGFQSLGKFAMFREEQIVNTDEQGKFEFEGVEKDLYFPQIAGSKVVFSEKTLFVAGETVDGGELRFALREPTVLRGKVTSGEDRVPVQDQLIGITNYVSDDPFVETVNDGRPTVPLSIKYVRTNSDGEFESSVGFGKYHISGPGHFAPVEIVVDDERELSVDLHLELSAVGSIKGKVIDSVELQPVAGARVEVVYRSEEENRGWSRLEKEILTDEEGKFDLERSWVPLTIYVVSKDRTMAAFVEVDSEQQFAKVKLLPFQTVTGRLVDGESGNPMANAYVSVMHQIRVSRTMTQYISGSIVKTNAEGRFEAGRVLPGLIYQVDFKEIVDGVPRSSCNMSEVTLEPSTKPFDLGDVTYFKPAERK